ncbi:MAG: zf-HC2 domain-containing protein [candidate division KSB1 bacterium]|nr:zf-HC2 domain-containing protein [candidate division KSB1 bacterium]MDZ7274719.1 zf-HC2 domain-containing protein [candidate division KSB1 bacterium]MDZ7285544.1 zf-HC2 domain-containing protein [candidate division KSB1 bacterium]MDZ7298576.1 zf-HC2 domain-containing protein [candidate division KSB1 bacterium]MDZ7309417.1 zf-HC2 domain-containing protein [candidate division KSB1 bacterium]
MNTCERFSESFSDYIENSLPAAERQKLETHLSACHACHDTVTRLHHLRSQLRSLPRVRTSDDFTAVLRARLKREQRVPHPGRLVGTPNRLVRTAGYAGAALMLVMVLGYLVWRPQTPTAAASHLRPSPTRDAAVTDWQDDPATYPARITYPLDKITPAHPIFPAHILRGLPAANATAADSAHGRVISSVRPVRATFISSF